MQSSGLLLTGERRGLTTEASCLQKEKGSQQKLQELEGTRMGQEGVKRDPGEARRIRGRHRE